MNSGAFAIIAIKCDRERKKRSYTHYTPGMSLSRSHCPANAAVSLMFAWEMIRKFPYLLLEIYVLPRPCKPYYFIHFLISLLVFASFAITGQTRKRKESSKTNEILILKDPASKSASNLILHSYDHLMLKVKYCKINETD